MSAGPLIAIGLDAADPLLVERWMDEGRLPTLARLRATGTYTRLANFDYCRAEAACTSFLTGCPAWQTGRWGSFKFHPGDYSVEDLQAYDFDEYPPFYAATPGRRVAVFDLPQTRIAPQVDGIQVLGWGAHSALTPRTSVPEGLLEELTARHGEHPTYDEDHCALGRPGDARDEGRPRNRYRAAGADLSRAAGAGALGLVPDVLRRNAFGRPLLLAPERVRSSAARDRRRTGGLAAGHLSGCRSRRRRHPGCSAAGCADRLVLRSRHGVEQHGLAESGVPSGNAVSLGFPSRVGLESGRPGALPPPVVPRAGRSWTDEVWARRHDRNPLTRAMRRRLPVEFFHYTIEKRLGINSLPLCPEDCHLGHEPPMWYHPACRR